MNLSGYCVVSMRVPPGGGPVEESMRTTERGMTCQMCGARVPEGRASCVQCGAMAGRAPGVTLAAPFSHGGLDTIRVCPRCNYQGTSVHYFAGGTHILWLVALTVMSGGPLGILYLLLRGGHRMCPNCQLKWGRGGHRALPVAPGQRAPEMAPEIAALSDGAGKRGFGMALFVLAAFLAFAGIVATEAVPLMLAGMAGGAGFLLRKSGNEDRERRRDALLQSLHAPVLRLAAQRGGRLTVTQVAQDLNWTLPRAEKVLQSMEDGFRVMGDVTPEGVIVFDFPELMHAAPAPTLPPPAEPREGPRLMA